MWDNTLTEFFTQEIKELGLDSTNKIVQDFNIYSEMLKEWNDKINLTAITDDKGIIIKHFIDSLTILPIITKDKLENENTTLIDIGTGAGFPGIPVKIMNENINVTLLDSLDKRIKFLNSVITELELKGIVCHHGRAEDFGRNKDFREKFDFCTARAVAKLPVLLEYCLPFVKVGGSFIAMKGSDLQEIKESNKALELMGGEITDIKKLILPEDNIERNIIIIRKVRQTPTRFPRKAGKPSKNPII